MMLLWSFHLTSQLPSLTVEVLILVVCSLIWDSRQIVHCLERQKRS